MTSGKSLTCFYDFKEDLKKELDKLPDYLLDQVYALLEKMVLKEKTVQRLTIRNFTGKLDQMDIRKAAYE